MATSSRFPELRLSPGPQQHVWTTPFWRHVITTGSQNLWLAMYNHAFQAWEQLLQLIEPHRQALVDDLDRPLSWEECPAPPSVPRGLTLKCPYTTIVIQKV